MRSANFPALLILVGFLSSIVVVGAAEPGAILYASTFQSGLDPKLIIQAPNSESIRPTAIQQRGALCITINKSDDYSQLLDGVPRAQVSFASVAKFARGTEYLIRWTTLIPKGFEFDSQQVEGIAQIHEGSQAESPPFAMGIDGSRYKVRVQGNDAGLDIGDATADKERWVQWSLIYKPDDKGVAAKTELYKDGKLVFNGNGVANALADDDGAYFKIGLYKWLWQSRPSAVGTRSMYFGDVGIVRR